eukprot:6314552-Amphidinium_carterae.1
MPHQPATGNEVGRSLCGQSPQGSLFNLAPPKELHQSHIAKTELYSLCLTAQSSDWCFHPVGLKASGRRLANLTVCSIDKHFCAMSPYPKCRACVRKNSFGADGNIECVICSSAHSMNRHVYHPESITIFDTKPNTKPCWLASEANVLSSNSASAANRRALRNQPRTSLLPLAALQALLGIE